MIVFVNFRREYGSVKRKRTSALSTMFRIFLLYIICMIVCLLHLNIVFQQ